MRPDARQIMRDATRLKDERFKQRDDQLSKRKRLRFQLEKPDIPDGYKDTAEVYMTPLPQEEGRAVAALVYAFPQITVPAPEPEEQALTTKIERFVSAMHLELEDAYGHHWWKSQMSQIHEDIGWIYAGMKRKPYDGQPSPPDGNDPLALETFNVRNRRYKRDAGISAAFDYRHVPTDTVYYVGDVGNPLAVFEIKEVDEYELMLTYNVRRNKEGSFDKLPKDVTSLPSGDSQDNYWATNTKMQTIKVVEYWDRQWCMIVAEGVEGQGKRGDPSVLDEWEHGWGRVPYFAAPAFENEVRDEAFKFESPLNGIYNEAPHLNRLRTMMSNVAYLTGYPSWQITTRPEGDQLLDDSGQPKTQIKFTPGYMFQAAPGQEVLPLPMQTGSELQGEVLASEARMRQFALADIAKGVSPGADTANSAISQLRRLQRSALEPLSENRAMQAKAMYRFWLDRIEGTVGEGIGEAVFVFDKASNGNVELAPLEIVTKNIQVKVAADTGQDMLIEEKQAFELMQLGGITEQEFHERRGKENPEEYVRANVLERLWKMIEPQMQTMILADLGDVQAITQLIEANATTGDANTAVPDIMAQISERMNTGMGSGSGGMPREMGVRSPAIAQTTQPGVVGEFGGA